MKTITIPSLLLFSAMFAMGCGNPVEQITSDYDSIKVTKPEEGATALSIDLTCKEYAGRNESGVCDNFEECVTVYWMKGRTDTGLSPEELASQALSTAKACKSFTSTPETLTFTIEATSTPSTDTTELVIAAQSNASDSEYIRYILAEAQ